MSRTTLGAKESVKGLVEEPAKVIGNRRIPRDHNGSLVFDEVLTND